MTHRPAFTFGSAAALLIGISASACGTGAPGAASSAIATASPAVATATPSTLPGSGVPTASETASPSESTAPEEGLGPFVCAFPIRGAATVAHTQITRLAVGTHDTYDRIVFGFAAGIPEYTIDKASPPLLQDPSGQSINVQGSSFLRIVLHGASAEGYGGTPYNGATSFTPRFAKLVDLQSAGDFEAVASWYAGMNGDACVRVFTLTAPTRLVIDLQH